MWHQLRAIERQHGQHLACRAGCRHKGELEQLWRVPRSASGRPASRQRRGVCRTWRNPLGGQGRLAGAEHRNRYSRDGAAGGARIRRRRLRIFHRARVLARQRCAVRGNCCADLRGRETRRPVCHACSQPRRLLRPWVHRGRGDRPARRRPATDLAHPTQVRRTARGDAAFAGTALPRRTRGSRCGLRCDSA